MSQWTLTFRAEGDGPPAECRVRRLLKVALRGYGLRCVGYGVGPRRTARDARTAAGVGRAASGGAKRRGGPGKANER